jgi:hypothetical protein
MKPDHEAWDMGPEFDLDTDVVEWRRLTQPETLTVLSMLDGTGCSIHVHVKQASQREGRCAAYGCIQPVHRGVRGIGGRDMRWCEDHHALVEILLIVRRGWGQGQDLLAELARYRQEVTARVKDRETERAEEARVRKLDMDRQRERRAAAREERA